MDVDSEREDGEIVDDEDEIFEDVSDCSIVSAYDSGKSLTYQDNISIISLSSISDKEEPTTYSRSSNDNDRHHRLSFGQKRKSSRHRHRCRKRYREYLEHSDSASDEDKFDQTVLRQLKEAVRINNTCTKNNNLEMRLKQMLNGNSGDKKLSGSESDNNNPQDEELNRLRSDALSTKNFKEKKQESNNQNYANEYSLETITKSEGVDLNNVIDDQELIELRLAALKSAVIKKHLKRKKKKEFEGGQKESDLKISGNLLVDPNEMNKENTLLNEDNLNNANDVLMPDPTIDLVDACNLKKIEESRTNPSEKGKIQISTETINTTTEEDVDIMRAKLLASISKKITSTDGPANAVSTTNKNAIQTIDLKSLNVVNKKSVHSIQKTTNIKLSSNILKMPIVKPLVINLNEESETDTTDIDSQTESNPIAIKVTEFLKKTRAEVEANSQNSTKRVIPNEISVPNNAANDTSDSILAEKSVVKLLPKAQQQEYRMLKQKLLNAKRKRTRKPSLKNLCKKNISQTVNNLDKKNTVATSSTNVAQKSINTDVMITKNDRLQMKGKYKELEPLLEKVNQASAQKKKLENKIRNLLGELKQARRLLIDSQLHFSKLVKELILKKESLDKRFRLNKLKSVDFMNVQLPSSTPVKGIIENPGTKTLEQPVVNIKINEAIAPQSPLVPLACNDADDPEKPETANLTGENETVKLDNFTEYISPLGVSTTRNVVTDPLGTFCPYEIFGVCKDPECTYKHYA